MEKWKYKSLDWIHKVREENYSRTKTFLPSELIEKTRNATEAAVKEMGLKVIKSKEQVRAHY